MILYLVSRVLVFLGICLLVVELLLIFGFIDTAKAAEITIPRAAQKYQATLTRAARAEFGLDAPVALLAAQVHQESLWNPGAASPAGARGIAQFMPATAAWMPEIAPQLNAIDAPNPENPVWALRALCAYDLWLFERVTAESVFDRWAFALSGYNGGLGWVKRDQAKAAAEGFLPGRWFGQVETVNAGRGKAAFAENRGYPRRIMLELAPVYERAGWGASVYTD